MMRLLLVLVLSALTANAVTREVGSGQTYASIGAAITAASAGDVINIRTGTYTETVMVNKNNLTLQANSGDSPIISGRVELNGQTGVTITGMKITAWASSGAGNYGIHSDTGSGLTVSNCDIYDGWGTAVYVRNSTNCVISGNTLHANKNTSAADGTGIVIISGHASAASYATSVQLLNNTVYDNETDGIQIHGQYITVSGNNVYNNITTTWSATHPDGIQFIAASSDGFTDCQHVKLFNNVFRNHTQNIFVEGSVSGDSSTCSDILIWNNIAYCDSATVNGVSMDSIATKGMMIKYVKDCVVVNNTVGRSGNTAVYFQACGTAGIVFKNNIVQNALLYGLYNDTTASAVSGGTDYNIYNCADSAIIWGSSFYASRSAFHAAVAAQETNGKDGASLISSWSTPSLTSSSPCINAGATIGSTYESDFIGTSRPQGAAWDIGAYEYILGGTAPSVTSSLTSGGTVGVSYTYTITGSNTPTSYNAIGLPSGLSVDTGTGVISGTPTAAAVTSATISATNATGTGSATLTLTVVAAPTNPSTRAGRKSSVSISGMSAY